MLTKYEDIVDTPHDGYFRLGLRSHGKGTFHSFVEKGKELETAKMQRVEANKFILNITFAWEHAVAITDENDKGKLVSHRFPQFSLDESLSPKFLKFLILDNNFRHYLELCSPGGAGRNRVLNISDMLKYKILVPQISEQQKIGSFFDKIDNTITLQQRKLNSLQKLKKGLLQKMFPKNGENIPEIRFPEFSDAWKQRKLREVVKEFYNGQTPYRQNKAYWGGNVNWLASGDLNRGVVTNTIEKITEEGQKASRLRIIPKGTLVIAIMGLEAAGTRGNCCILGINTTINQACMALIANESIATKDFLFQWYKAFGNSLALKFTQGTKQQNYNEELLGNLDISYPSLKEQQQIGSFFTQLDNTITLQQRWLFYTHKQS